MSDSLPPFLDIPGHLHLQHHMESWLGDKHTIQSPTYAPPLPPPTPYIPVIGLFSRNSTLNRQQKGEIGENNNPPNKTKNIMFLAVDGGCCCLFSVEFLEKRPNTGI